MKWGPGRRDEFIRWAQYELQRVRSQRDALEKTWRGFLEQYRAPEPKGIRRFPFEGPLSRDTELLTVSGWKRIDTIRIGDAVLTRGDADGQLEWQPVLDVPQVFAEKLYHFKSRSVDLLTTAGHTMLCVHQDNYERVVRMRADELWNRTGYYLPQHGTWKGRDYDLLFGHDAGDVCEFVGWYLSEGWVCKGYKGGFSSISIGQSDTANPEKCWRIEKLLTRLGWKWSKMTSNSGYTVSKLSVPTKLYDMLVAQRGAATKRVPQLFFTLSERLIDRLLSAMIAGDGCVHDSYPQGTAPKVHYFTCSRGLADDVQVLTTLLGLHGRVRSRSRVGTGGVMSDGRQIVARERAYEVTVCSATFAKYDRTFKEIVDYNDIAFCVTVKNHAIYARRHGKACWTGNSSNRTFPLTAMTLDAVLPRYMRTLHAQTNVYTIQALNERWIPVAKPIQDYLEYLDHNVLNLWDLHYRTFDEMLKLGTGIIKTGWRFESHRVTGYDATLTRTQVIRQINQPTVDHVPLAHFLIPPEAISLDPDAQGGACWVAERQRYRPYALAAMAKAQAPFLPNFDPAGTTEVLKYEESAPTEHQQKVAELDSLPPTTSLAWQRPVELYEIHARFDTTGNGFEDDVVVVFHDPSLTILRATYNPWAHGKRPYHVVRYRRGDGFYGIGICEQAKMWQDTISDVLNFDIDKILLSNSPMLAFKEGANVLPNEQIFPGKMWPLSDPKNDLVPIFLAAPGSFDLNSLMAFLQENAKQRTGVTDLQAGTIGAIPSRTPATTIQALLQEGNTRFDMSLQDVRLSGLNHVGLQVLQLLQQQAGNVVNNPDGKKYVALAAMVLGQPEGQYVSQALQLPFEAIETGIGVQLTATSGTANKELAKQSQLALLQLYAQLGPQFLQLAQVVQQAPGSPMAEVATQLFRGGAEFMTRLLEQFDIRNAEDLIPNVQAILQAQAQAGGGQPISPLAQGGGNNGAQGAAAFAGMAGV